MKKLLHIANRKAEKRVWRPVFIQTLKEMGDLTIVEDGNQLSDEECEQRMRQCNVLITSWGARPVPKSIAANRGELEYICHVTGTVRIKLYKGNCAAVGIKSPYSLYREDIATFSEDEVYNQSDAEGFINLFGLPETVSAKFRK